MSREKEQPIYYWRGLSEYEQVNGDAHSGVRTDEFALGEAEAPDLTQLTSTTRRQFLGLMAASGAFAATACTAYPDQGEIVAYNKRPEEIFPGEPTYYASTCSACDRACGLLIKTREGRPIKIDGNPDHPINRGKICARGHAQILGLYEPDRLKQPFRIENGKLGTAATWEEVDGTIVGALGNNKKKVALISNRIVSPTAKAVIEQFLRAFPQVTHYAYEQFHDGLREQGWKQSYGRGRYPLLDWGAIDLVVALEADVLGTEGDFLESARGLAAGRTIDAIKKFNRLVAVEGAMSLTGMHADTRVRLHPSLQLEFVLALIHDVTVTRHINGIGGTPEIAAVLKGYDLKSFCNRYFSNTVDTQIGRFRRVVGDLVTHRGRGIVLAGSRLPAPIHVAVNFLNAVLRNDERYLTNRQTTELVALTEASAWIRLIKEMNDSKVGMVIHFDSNPVYQLPAALGYRDALKKTDLVVTLAESVNESAMAGNWVLPIHHLLESWGDAQVRSGIYSLAQPVVAPLQNSRQKEGVLLAWGELANGRPGYSEERYRDYLKAYWRQTLYPLFAAITDFDLFWQTALHDGVAVRDVPVEPVGSVRVASLKEVVPTSTQPVQIKPTLLLREGHYLRDGRLANNGWLQELPHPVSKVTWDNYAAMSIATAKQLGIKNGDQLVITSMTGDVEIPAFIQPGMIDELVEIELGRGRTSAGRIGEGVGTDAKLLLPITQPLMEWIVEGITIKKTGRSHPLVSTQEHHAIDQHVDHDIHLKRQIIREGTILSYLQHPDLIAKTRHDTAGLYRDYDYQGYKWAMAIDLNRCTGCGLCTAACNVENNIPVVGKDQVDRNREMAWIRIDRYYAGNPEEPTVSTQPMLCQHCDNAPCEVVCPTAATTHSAEGLNDMAYNRCVGTRYCSNNCPYKVRRFNFFDFRDRVGDGYYLNKSFRLLNNPEVTVRSRGVIEKCTFCVQRITAAKHHAQAGGRDVRDGDFQTACQQACPTEAITFGNANDPRSRIAKLRKHRLGYAVLEDLHVKPNVTYIAKLRNRSDV